MYGRILVFSTACLYLQHDCVNMCRFVLTCTPLRQIFAISRELQYPGIAVAIRYKDVPGVGVYSHVGGLAEVAAVTSWCESLSQGQQGSVCAITAYFYHLKIAHDGRPCIGSVAIRVNGFQVCLP